MSDMVIVAKKADGQEVWSFGKINGQTSGMTSTKYREDGTLKEIISALELALFQAEGELSLSANKSD